MYTTFLWPEGLFLLALLPLLAVAYLWSQLRRRRFALRYSSLSLIRPALGRHPGLRRHVPPALFLLALSSLLISLARPAALIRAQSQQVTIILVIDVSFSMRNIDIPPNRLRAAENAALSFIHDQKPDTRIGIVQFSSDARLVMAPTTDHNRLNTAVQSLTTGESTAIGSGIFTALDAITSNRQGKWSAPMPGTYAPEIIILLTDGVTTNGPPPQDAAAQAAQQGVRIYTIGFGTLSGLAKPGYGTPIVQQTAIPVTGGAGAANIEIDEESLREIAAMTGGKYFASDSATSLEKVFSSLSAPLATTSEMHEISIVFIALGALLAAVAITLSQFWFPLL